MSSGCEVTRPKTGLNRSSITQGLTRPNVLLVVQPSVSHYREPMIHALSGMPAIRVDFAGKYDSPEGKSDHRERVAPASEVTLKLVRQLRVTRLFGPVTWESGIVRLAASSRYDVVVLEGRIYTLSTWVGLLARRALGRRTLLWGHGWRRRDGGVKRHFRLLFYRLADGVMVYGDRAAQMGRDVGYPSSRIFVVGNSIYPRALMGRLPSINGPVFQDLDRSRPTVLCVSRLSPRRGLALLIEAAERLSRAGTPVNVVLVGDGAAKGSLESLAARKGIPVRFLGPVYLREELAAIYAAANATVIPGAAGLGIVQSLAFGCPVIIHDNDDEHGPESEAVRDGVNGSRFREGSIESLADTILEVCSWRLQRPSLAQACAMSVVDRYSAESHAGSITSAILATVKANC
jgi:glycosyltransferase involved in cell wall biosynthesis